MAELKFASADAKQIIADMSAEYEKAFKEATGKSITLRPDDTARLMIATATFAVAHLEALIDWAAKMNLVQYSEGQWLDELAEAVRLARKEPTPAFVTVRITFSTALPEAQTIRKGMRVTSGNGVYWETEEEYHAPEGATELLVRCVCKAAGADGNGYLPGAIRTLVDTSAVRYFSKLENIDISSGGADRETDEALRERVRTAPETYAATGTEEGYTHRIKAYDANISDALVISPSPGRVTGYIAMKDGTEPSETYLSEITAAIRGKRNRPMTDCLSVSLPDAAEYAIDMTYFISSSNAPREAEIKEKVAAAIEEYIEWQSCRIGRDIDPSELTRLVKNAGAARVSVLSPVYTALQRGEYSEENGDYNAVQIARCIEVSATYGGLTDG